jgi:hypothetical protein
VVLPSHVLALSEVDYGPSKFDCQARQNGKIQVHKIVKTSISTTISNPGWSGIV